MGLKFAESGSTLEASSLVGEVVEKGGTLGEASMDQTSSVSPGDEVVAVGGASGLLKYFKTGNRQDNSSSEGSLAEAIDKVAEPVRLQLQRHFDPVKVLYFFTFRGSILLLYFALKLLQGPKLESLIVPDGFGKVA